MSAPDPSAHGTTARRSRTDVLLIGGGVASASAAQTLREEGFSGSVTLLTRELDPPYHRPPASKGRLGPGGGSRQDLVLPAAWYADNDVDLRTRSAVATLDPERRIATLPSREEVTYGRALLATGAMVRRLDVPGAGLRGIHHLRSLRNADRVRTELEDLRSAGERLRVVLVGGSYVGCEVAASLAELGIRATVLMQEGEPLERTFGTEVGRWVRRRLEDRGVELRGGVEVASFRGAAADPTRGRVASVLLAGGDEIPADLVVVGVGATPDVALAQRAGLALGATGGVRCDALLRTSADGVWAAGDVCEYASVLHRRRVRIEHEDVATRQGRHVARQWLGLTTDFRAVPYFFSDLGSWCGIEAVGPLHPWDRTVVEGDLSDDAFGVWFLAGSEISGFASFNGAGDLKQARRRLGAVRPAGGSGGTGPRGWPIGD